MPPPKQTLRLRAPKNFNKTATISRRRGRQRKETEDEEEVVEILEVESTSIENGVEADDDDTDALYCLCEKESEGDMVKCDNDLCPREWFHFKCVEVAQNPDGKWYCPECRDGQSNSVKDRKRIIEQLRAYNEEKERTD